MKPKAKSLRNTAFKVDLMREHLLKRTPLAELCKKNDLAPSTYYGWQETLFNNADAALEKKTSLKKNSGQDKKLKEKISLLEGKIQQKDSVLVELMQEHMLLKKSLGEI